MTRRINMVYGCAPLALGIALASSAMAQVNADPATPQVARASSAEVGEIIVTAQKRAQSINDVGMSINAISSDALQNQRLVTTGDLTRVVPALSVVPAGSSIEGAPVYTLRGIGFNARNLSGISAVSVYSDEVPFPYPYMTAGPLIDIERVEVLKGPQGTLYGQNSTGGTINYIANKPTRTLQAGAEATYGRFDLVDVTGYVSGPLSDTLAARVSARSIRSGGWQDSITTDQHFGQQRQLAGRILLDWTPSETVRFQANVNGFRDRSGTTAFQVVGLNPALPFCFDGTPPGCIASGGGRNKYYDGLVNFPIRPDSPRAADQDANGNFKNNNNFVQGSLRGDWDISSDVKLTSITTYSHLEIDSNRDIDGTPFFLATFRARGKIKAFGQEVRLSGQAFDDRLNWITGANYSNDTIRENNHNPADGTTLGQALGITDTVTQTFLRRKSGAVFANADYELTDQLSLTGGVRYTKTKLNFSGCTRDPGNGTLSAVFGGLPGACVTYLDVTGAAPGAQGNVTKRNNEHNVAWRTGLNFKPSRHLLVYGNISRGYKAGDIPAITALVESQLLPVKQEKVTAYEVGTKVTTLDGKLQVKGAVFYYDYTNKQLQTDVLTFLGHAEATVNVPKSRVKGAELEFTLRPVRALTLAGGVGYTNSRIKQFSTYIADTSPVYPPPPGFDQSPFRDVSGSPFNLAPKWQANGDAQYDVPLGNGGTLSFGASLLYASNTKPFVGASNDYDLKAHTLLDLRAGYRSPDDKWRLTVFGKNVTNKLYYVGGIASFDDAGLYAGQPATYGVTLGVNFQ